MKYIKPYQIFEASAPAAALTQEQIDWLDKCVDGRWKLNTQTGFVDVVGSFDCGKQGLTDFKGVKFGKVSGSFYCEVNGLTTLVGAPQTVGGIFRCGGNPVSESTLSGIFALMKKGMAYQQALEKLWSKMKDVDRVLMYKEMTNLSPEEMRKYKALATYANIKGYL
jgi:hypothetical protein